MRKNGTKPRSRKARPPQEPPPAVRRLRVPEILVNTRASLRELTISVGLQVFQAMLEEDRELLCGPRHQPQKERWAYRHGHEAGTVVFGGRKIRVRKPRVRRAGGGELELPTWGQMAAGDPLEARVVEQVLVGVSTHGYGRSLEPLGAETPEAGTSQSSASRRLVARTTRQVTDFLARPLEGLDLPVIMIDGTGLGEHLMLVVLGIDHEGHKHILGAREGTTESSELCLSLLRDLLDRGLPVERARLFVIDGGKGIRKAIRQVFNDWAQIQRCQVHKRRNVLEQLPQARRPWVRAAMKRAWAHDDEDKARAQLKRLASQLDDDCPGAASALREGLDETLTLIGLGVSGTLHRTLCSTNPIENLQGTIKRVTRNVKRWRNGKMAFRWAITALTEAARNFRRIRGHRGLPQLTVALQARKDRAALDSTRKVA